MSEPSFNLRQMIEEEGGVIIHGLVLISYFTSEGEETWAYATLGEPRVHNSLGLLSVAEHAIASQIETNEID